MPAAAALCNAKTPLDFMKCSHIPKEELSMAETVKKTTSKPKATTKAKTPATSSSKKIDSTNGVSKPNGHPSNVTEMKLSREQIAQLAHRYWIERGHQHGHHEEDWYRAEQELRGKAS